MHGPTYTRQFGSARSRSVAAVVTLRLVASVNGAWPSGVGSMPSTMWCMIGLPTSTTSSSVSRPVPARSASSPMSSSSAVRTASVRWRSPPGFIITYDTRLMRSSPKRICGFMRPALASTSPLVRSHRWPAIVVDPMSTATPNAASTKPGQIATSRSHSSIATVTAPRCSGERRLERCQHPERHGRLPVGGAAVLLDERPADRRHRREIVAGIAELELRHLDVPERERRIDRDRWEVEVLAHHLAVHLAARRARRPRRRRRRVPRSRADARRASAGCRGSRSRSRRARRAHPARP